MKPAPFTYHAPESIGDVCALLAEYGDDAKVLAGGQSLVPMLALRLTRFEHLIDINRVDGFAGVTRANGSVVVRAGTRQRALEREPTVPLLAAATPLIGHFQIRNRGTVGGSLAHADPASEYPAVAVALGAEMEIESVRGSRRVPADEFFVGTWTTCMADDEVLTAVHFRAEDGGHAIEEVARRHGDFALAGVACAMTEQRVGLALFGVGATPVRCRDAEDGLRAGASAADIAAVAVRDLDAPSDVHASGTTRTRIARHLVERAVTRARS